MEQWSNIEGGPDPMPNDAPMASPFRSSGPQVPAWYEEEVSDALLLDRYVEQWDHAAFRDLVRRHGPMVLGVCRRILRDPDAAEDAFQATFLLLVRKAGSVRKRESVGPWLYGVARRVALEARGVASRRQAPVRLDPEAPGVDEDAGLERDELHAALHEELGRLPEKYRTPLVLCYLEGLTHEAVARQLGWPIGTVRVRIARGRDLLGTRLRRRGLAPATVLLALCLMPETAAAVPRRLVEATVRTAARLVAGERVPRGEVPARVVDLERKVRNVMQLTRLKWVTALAVAVIVTGAGVAAVVPTALAAADDAAKAQAEQKKLQGTWAVVTFEKAGVRKEGDANAEQIQFEGDTFSILHGGHVEENGTIKLDPSKDPLQIDLHFREGKHEGQTDLAIYAWDGANLKLCWVKEGSQRPTDFTTKPGDDRVLLVLKRQDP
jgi:RNA polymerase sigma-70 factor (ECF subfamily)